MKIVFFGTPEFASSQLKAIIIAGYDVVAVVTTPDKPAGRGKKIHSSEVKKTALEYGLPVLQPEHMKDPKFINILSSYHADLFVVVAFRILPEIVWNMPPLGTFNLHASLLPQYRGAAPINYAIINGEKETGLTTFFINKEIDTGAIIMQEKVTIDADDTAGSLHDKLMNFGNPIVVDTIKLIEEGRVHLQNQNNIIQRDNSLLKRAPKIVKEDCNIDWSKDSMSIYNFVRGLSPYPAAHTRLVSENDKILDLKIFKIAIEEKSTEKDQLYHVKTDGKSYLKIILKDFFVSILNIQQAGRKAMPIAEFLRGTRILGDWKVAIMI